MYQNGIEPLHAFKKRIQCFKEGSVLEPVNTIKTLVECEENKEVLTLYDGGYVLSQDLICSNKAFLIPRLEGAPHKGFLGCM